MKNTRLLQNISIIIVGILFFASCEIDNNIEGNGKVINQRRNATEFNEINIDGVLDVYLRQGELYKVEVVTDENLQEIVETEKVGDILYITTKDDVEYDASRMDVYITTPDIKKIKLEGVTALYTEDTLILSDVSIEKNNTGFLSFNAIVDNLSIVSQGVGNLELKGKSQNVSIDNDIVGDISAFEFKIFNLELVHRGTGNVEVFVTNSITLDIKGVGNVYCKGAPAHIENSGENIVGHLYMVD